MDLRDAVALSLLPGLLRRALTNEFREALRRDVAPAGQADVTLDTLHQRLGCNEPALRAAIRRARGLAERALGRGRVVGVEPIALNDSRYPDALAAVPDPPPVLWVRGQIAALATPSVAIVGSRAGSPYALEVARRLGADLAERGVTVVSGLARGVDSAAHRGALAASGRTVAVLGSGVDIVYPPEHAALAPPSPPRSPPTAQGSASSYRARRREPSIFRRATGLSVACRWPSWSSRRPSGAGRSSRPDAAWSKAVKSWRSQGTF